MNREKVSVLFKSKEQCCGCSLCAALCPVRAIEMRMDKFGFFYPSINIDLCLGCGRCVKYCDFRKSEMWLGNEIKNKESNT